MTLNDYLADQRLNDAQFAVKVGCDRSTIYRIRVKGQRPTPELAARIVLETGGLVHTGDLYPLAGLAA